jgi:anti-sigma regulatory factor (Ser/Thr protein kinase)
MATTRGILRAAAERIVTPGAVLERVNELLQPDIPPNMFVTCFYALLDPETGVLDYANAGHDVPYLRTEAGVAELRATGMPLGLLPGMTYEEKQAHLQVGDTVLFHSDGLVEAHDPQREMFGFHRLRELVGQDCSESGLTQFLLAQLEAFTGEEWEQEDDVTLVTLHRSSGSPAETNHGNALRTLAAFELASTPGNERQAMLKVAEAAAGLPLSGGKLERLKTAVAEATLNAMEHGNHYQEELPVDVQVQASPTELVVRIRDRGTGDSAEVAATPDLTAKLAGEQSPRGWGLFLIRNMVDEMRTLAEKEYHTIELVMKLANDAGEK